MSLEERKGLVYVALAAALFSTSPVLIRWADQLSPFIKTWARMLIGAVAVGYAARQLASPATIHTAEVALTTAHRRPVVRFLLYGLIAALHFLCAIASLQFTTPAHSLSIIYTAPIFVTLFSAIFLKEAVRPRQRIGVMVAVLGVAVLAGLEPHISSEMTFGRGLSLGSAVAFGF